jgi:hypothetical protein
VNFSKPFRLGENMETARDSTAEQSLRLRVILMRPPAGVDYGIQEGRGTSYRTIQKRRGDGRDVVLDCTLAVKTKNGNPQLSGPIVQGPPATRFLYVDVGQMAGQKTCPWSRRIKIPLGELTPVLLKKVLKAGGVLVAKVQGTAKDGGPACATVPLLDEWNVVKK